MGLDDDLTRPHDADSEDNETDREASSYWDSLGEEPSGEPADWSGDDLEDAYLRAMEVLSAAEATLVPTQEAPVVSVDSDLCPESSLSVHRAPVIAGAEVVSEAAKAEAREELTRLAVLREQAASAPKSQPTASMPRQIMESCLFVGGEPLTAKKLCSVLRDEFPIEFVEQELDELNSLYSTQGRPYEIRLGDGGYRLVLRDEFDGIRRKVFGLGPKEVKLNQEALEVLALVAYRQPITQASIEQLGKPGCSGVLRQLVRRELVQVERDAEQPRLVHYRTTPRFLSLIGIRNLNELPRHEHVAYK